MIDLAKLNSATKYPSILTYHEMGDRGRLSPTVQVPFPAGQPIFVTEKVDGTNGRIICPPRNMPEEHFSRMYVIGSREELLSAQGDLIYPPDYGIVQALRPVAEVLGGCQDQILVFFFEVYGGDLLAAKQYTGSKTVSLRMFDMARVPLEVLEKPIAQIASWRDHGGQDFVPEEGLNAQVRWFTGKGIFENFSVERVPSLTEIDSLPTTIEATYEWLKQFEKSKCDLGGGKGRAEGVVVRTADRKTIAKLRFEDYERTLGVKR